MKIFFCDNRLGGLLDFRVDIIKHLVSQGHDVTLLVPKVQTEWDRVGEKVTGVRIIELPMRPNGLNPLRDLELVAFLLKLYSKERPNIVFNYTIKPNIYSAFAAKVFNIKVVDVVAGLGYMFNGQNFFRRIGRWMYRFGLSKADYVMVLNEGNYQQLLENDFVKQEKMILLKGGEGINLHKYPYSAVDYSKDLIFLVVSRVLKDKGYNEYVYAAERVRALYPNTRVEWLGPIDFSSPMGITKETLEEDINRHIIDYLGVSNCVMRYLNRDGVVVVLPSYHEGMSHSLMEACAIGRPVIATDIYGCKEAVDDGINGYLVPKCDSDALAQAMLKMIRLSPEEKVEMGKASRKKAEKCFNVDDVINVYDNLIMRLF